MDETHQQLAKIAEHFAKHNVEFVVIGGWSIDATFPELEYRTRDIDFIIATDDENYERIAHALNELGVRETRGGIPRREYSTFEAWKLKTRSHWRLHCSFGVLDLMTEAAEIEGYEHIVDSAHTMKLGDVQIQVADQRVVLASKLAAGRRKDDDITGELAEAIKMSEAAHRQRNPITRLREWRQARKQIRVQAKQQEQYRSIQKNRERAGESLQPPVVTAAPAHRCGHVGKRSGVPCIRPPHRTGPHRYQ